MAFDFITPNKTESTEQELELLAKCFIEDTNHYWTDGTNPWGPRTSVCRSKKDGKLLFWTPSSNGDKWLDVLFTPTTTDARKVLQMFKEKGYYPYYDDEMGHYGYVKDKADIKGEYTIRHTHWL